MRVEGVSESEEEEAERRAGRFAGEMDMAETARAQASRRTRVAVTKMGMWKRGGRMRVRRGEQLCLRARA